MTRFFDSMDEIERFSSELRFQLTPLTCKQCLSQRDFVSHGYVYQQLSMNNRIKVGKRVICSNRFGRRGCGFSFRCLLNTRIPQLKYSAIEVFTFILMLLSRLSVKASYGKATNSDSSRQGWRWLNRLKQSQSLYRSVVSQIFHPINSATSSKQLSPLQQCLEGLVRLFPTQNSCANFQQLTQTAFFLPI
ncbi:hypothetical protein [Aliikangiella sp. IMCC44359]|uniref:hypothetical protein n=1 Tax=Aliikangiella sp. IMCC44359 TaxID=3459125 RepID=UPI00403AB88D